MEYLLVVDGVQEDMVASGTSSGNWSCTPVTRSFHASANRLWTVGSGDVTGVVYGTCDSCVSTAIYGCTSPSAIGIMILQRLLTMEVVFIHHLT